MLETMASASGRGCTVEVARVHWRRPIEHGFRFDRAVLSMMFAPRSYRPEGRYADAGAGFEAIGPIFLIPPNRELIGRGPGGEHGVVSCFFDPAGNEIVARMAELTDAQLRRSLNLGSSTLTALMRSLAAEVDRPQAASQAMIDALTSALLIECGYRLFGRGRARPAPPARERDYLARIERCLEAPGPSIPSVQQLATLCGYSSSHLSRLFHRDMGQTIGHYLSDIRQRRGEELLTETDLSLKQIAWLLGFANPANFSTSFSKASGITPGRYRDRFRGTVRPRR